jgi:broad specificity phosphatase PhoE
MIVVVRHGERADDAKEEEKAKIPREFDPHLTKLGQKQGTDTGIFIEEYLKEKFSSKQFKNCYLVSSPFLRCIMTAEAIGLAFRTL